MSRKRSRERLYQKKAGGTFYGWYFDPADGRRVTVCTKTRDRELARLFLAKAERDAFEAHTTGRPAPNSGASHSVADALQQYVSLGGSDLSDATWKMVGVKSGQLLRLLGGHEVTALTIDHLQGYIETRLGEGAARETIRKELSVLRQALKLAHERGKLRHDPRLLFPRFRVRYIPRERHLTPEEAEALFQHLPEERRLWVLLAVLLGPRLSEVERADWRDVDLAGGWFRVRGTKTLLAHRRVPIPAPLRPHLEAAQRPSGPIVGRWRNSWRDLARACRRADIERVSANDLRRTFASWMKQGGEDSAVVARLLGHSSTRMVDLVYGKLNDENYKTAVARLPALALPPVSSEWVAERAPTERAERAERQPAVSTATTTENPENIEAPGTLQSRGPLVSYEMSVPGPGIEPGTRGFSIPCSTI